LHTGIDSGLRTTAIVTLDDANQVLYQTHFGSDVTKSFAAATKGHLTDRLKMYDVAFRDHFDNYKITGTVVFELPFGKLTGNGLKLYYICAVYILALADYIPSHKIFLLTASEIKRKFTGDGAANKQDMIRFCEARGFFPKTNDHLADSYAMAWIGVNGKIKGGV